LSSRAAVLALALVLAGCGFRLRGTADVPFQTLYVPNATSGIALDPGPDQSRTIALRIGGVAVAQSAGMDAGMANVYDIIRWFPETDGRKPK